jgi:hypothetical protein
MPTRDTAPRPAVRQRTYRGARNGANGGAGGGVSPRVKVLQVNYHRERGQADAEQAEHLRHAAEGIAKLDGLRWKIWIYDDEAKLAGGLYLFDDEASARAFGDGILPRSLGALPGVSGISATYFDVDEALTAVTRGPLAEPAAAAP